jgi:hypothetical protein
MIADWDGACDGALHFADFAADSDGTDLLRLQQRVHQAAYRRGLRARTRKVPLWEEAVDGLPPARLLWQVLPPELVADGSGWAEALRSSATATVVVRTACPRCGREHAADAPCPAAALEGTVRERTA